MSRKRLLKKERSRLDELERQVGRLDRQSAAASSDTADALLELVQGRAAELSPASLEAWVRAAERALREALAAADLLRIKRLLRWLGRDARSVAPVAALAGLAALADTAVHLADGRLAEARACLDGLPAAAPGIPPRLVHALAGLCSGETEVPGAPAAWSFYSALSEILKDGEARKPRQDTTVALRAALPASRILDAADDFFHLLAELARVKKTLQRAKVPSLVPLFLDRTKDLFRPLLAAFRDEPPAPLLLPLRHALRLRWRSLLELMAERAGPAAWAGLYPAAPLLFDLDLEIPGGLETLRRRSAVRELHETGRHRQLAERLASLSAAERAPERRVVLWSLELWAWSQVDPLDGMGDDPWEIGEAEEIGMPAHAALVRLGRMAEEAATRLPPEHRTGTARFLRAHLLELCEAQPFCNHMLEAAGALLAHLPDDPALLFIALAGAASSKDGRARHLFEERIAARGAARGSDREPLLRLVAQAAEEGAELTVRLLPPLRVLLGEEGWPEALDAVVRALTGSVCNDLLWMADGVRTMQRELDLYRAALGERPGFAVLEAALACLRPHGRGTAAVRELLARLPELEVALGLVQVLAAAAGPDPSREAWKALDAAREAAISRLDLRLRLWWPLYPLLLIGMNEQRRRLLVKRLDLLLKSEVLNEEDRNTLQRARASAAGTEQPRRPAGPKKPRRRKPVWARFGF